MPRAMQYKTGSIIFFKGDNGDKIYILQQGKVSLNYTDIETGQEIHEMIKMGEFFGVKSAMGASPREETAMVLADTSVLIFSVPEFEDLAMKNTRIIMKMLKVFSNQLRRIHNQVQNLVGRDSSTDPETGLFNIATYYYKCRKLKEAGYTFRRYLTYFPSGKFAEEANKKLVAVEQGVTESDNSIASAAASNLAASTYTPGAAKTLTDAGKEYYNAVSLLTQQKYAEALKSLKAIAANNADPEYAAKADYDAGRCYYALKQYTECIQHFSKLIQTYPKHPDLNDGLFIIAQCYISMGQPAKAEGLFAKLLTMVAEDDPLKRKIQKTQREMKGGKA